ncbi:MAG: hypothetical protein ABSH36_00060 [Solirubrobacteraceae bacterium]
MIAYEHRRSIWVLVTVLVAIAATATWTAPSARAEEAGVGWEEFARAYPTNLHPGGTGTLQIDVMNVGSKKSGGVITVTDILPQGVNATKAGGMPNNGSMVESPEEEEQEVVDGKPRGGARWHCVGTQIVTCTSNPLYLNELPIGAGQSYRPVERIGIEVKVGEGLAEGSVSNRVTVAGGGAAEESAAVDQLTVSTSVPGFGFSGWDVWFSSADGTVGTQAGSHPYETTFALGFNESEDGGPAGGEARDLEVELPPGFFGEPNAVPRCNRLLLDAEECPANTELGNDMVFLGERAGGPDGYILLPVYNMEPPQGVADEFAVKFLGRPSYFDTGPRGYGNHSLVTHIDNIPALGIIGNIVTLWGVAPEKSHDAARLSYGESEEDIKCAAAGCPSDSPPRPFLTLPTSCDGPQSFTIRALSTWENEDVSGEERVASHGELDEPIGFTGCSSLSFDPSLSTVPDTSEPDTPAGLGVSVTFPQEALRAPEGLVESTVKSTSVTLPEGLVINAGQAAGLQACTEEQAKLKEEGAPECPLASKVGTVKVKTPLLEGASEGELTGDVYVLPQSGGLGDGLTLQSHPPTLQLLVAVSGDGVNLKLVANVQLNEATGQITTTIGETPGLPFTCFELTFSGGPQAALATPTPCGTYTTTSDFTPWTSPFDADAFPSSSFQIGGDPQGSGCPSQPLPFTPTLIAGSTTDEAGGFTNFSLLLRRGDGQQRIEKLQFKAPPGLTGMIGAVTQCPEPEASKGECSSASQIGSATVASGPGPYPLVIPQPGEPESPIYLTGPYEGAPFGLSIVTHVIAGPFNLGTIITRAKIEIDPLTAQIIVTTAPLPQLVDGVPTDLRLINSVIDKQGFMFNPTNCEPSAFSGTAWGAQPPGLAGAGATAPISSRFQVGSCRSLAFKPTFKVSTSAHTSRVQGASLHVSLSLPNKAGLGEEANVRKVKVSLPKALPTPLKTLQKACLEKVFEANPADCPVASQVATAKVSTPVLPGGLTGTAYFVSHGGAKYPELIIVLTGENGVTIQVHGETFISKAGITTGTFSTAPDVPFTSFELTFPERQYPAFTADGDLCKGSLAMPTEMVGQNGLVVDQSTKIKITGCPKKTPKHKHKKKGAKHRQ